jgi:hypothetical protein
MEALQRHLPGLSKKALPGLWLAKGPSLPRADSVPRQRYFKIFAL